MMEAGGSVLRRHPKLIVLPMMSFLVFLIVTVAVIIPVAAPYGGVEAFLDSVEPKSPQTWVVLFAFYFSSMFVIILCNAALVLCALDVFSGRQPSVLGGLAVALSRWPQILMWTFVATTVGLLLNAMQSFLRDKLGASGSVVGGAVEFAWTVSTYFVLPLVVIEGAGPTKAVERSADILKRTWGEAVVAEGGLTILCWVLMLPTVPLVVLSIMISQNIGADWPTLIGVVLVLAYLLVVTLVVWALGVIFQAGVYVYATTGDPPGNMDGILLRQAFRRK